MLISHIVAISRNNVIGRDNSIPWKIPGELSRFKQLTMNRSVIMGRNTYESLEIKLVGRKVIVVSRTLPVEEKDYVVVRSIEQALEIVKDEEEVFIAGGGQIYRATIALADRLYITVIDMETVGDTYYPDFNKNDFELIFEKHFPEAVIPYTFYTYVRRK